MSGEILMKKVIEFSVKVTYETEDESPICEDAMRNNLQFAIENERVNGALTIDADDSDTISASDVDIEVTQTTESSLLDMSGAVELFVKNMMAHDGVTIEDFINEQMPFECDYREDSVWRIDGNDMDDSELSEFLSKELANIQGETLMSHFADWADAVDIRYEGDSLFYHMPDVDDI